MMSWILTIALFTGASSGRPGGSLARGAGPRPARGRGSGTGSEACPARPKQRARARALARKWFLRSVEAYRKGRYMEAYRGFLCTQSILPAGLTRYWIARSAQDAGLLDTARALFLELRDRPPEPVTRQEIQQRLQKVEQAIRRRREARRRARAGAGKRVAPLPRRTWRTVDWERVGVAALLGVSAALVVTSAITGGLAAREGRRIEDAEDGTWWDPDLQRSYDRRKDLLVATWATLGVGLVGAAAVSVYYLLRRTRGERQHAIQVRPTGTGLAVTW